MSAILTTKFRNQTARSFINSMAGANNFLYMFEGQTLPWPNDSNPPDPTESVAGYKTIWDNMLAAKLVTINNLSLVIPNQLWQENTVYTGYTDTNTMLFSGTSPFFIVTSNNEIYKCISNNNGSTTTTAPVGQGSSSNNYIQTTSDGYLWKYMLNVQPNDPFLNTFWAPVPAIAPNGSTQATIEASAVSGSIDFYHVETGGQNYNNGGQQFILTITGDGTGANAYAVVSGGVIQSVVPVNRGQGYSFATVSVSDPTGTGGTISPIMSPQGGHGSDASTELGATAVMVSISASNTEAGFFTISNQFRQNGLLLNPLTFGTNTISTNTLVKTAETVVVTGGIGSYVANEVVFQGAGINTSTFSGNVIDFDPVVGVLRMNETVGTPAIGSLLYGISSGSQRFITNVTNPDLQRYTGDILTIDNEIPISRTSLETDRFQFAFAF